VTDDFPLELKQFLAQHIESLAQLEMLLMMQREPERSWDCDELARGLYISSDMGQGILTDLERRGFAAASEGRTRFRYVAGDGERDRLLTELGRLYRERRVAVITQIYSNPVKKVQTFADAFRLRREE
jgi:hypothetical protein